MDIYSLLAGLGARVRIVESLAEGALHLADRQLILLDDALTPEEREAILIELTERHYLS